MKDIADGGGEIAITICKATLARWLDIVRPGCCIWGNAGSDIFNELHAHIYICRT